MIFVRLISGLGNQLFQYTVGRQLSIKHDVPLKLDTGFFKTQTLRSYALEHYNINASIASNDEIDAFLFWQRDHGLPAKIYRKVERKLPRTKQRYFKELEWWPSAPDLLNVSSNVYLDGYWQHYKYFQNICPEIFNELTVKETPSGAAVFGKNIIENHSSVSIHIRRGDYINDSDALNLMGVLPLAYYYNAVDLMNTKLVNPVYYIFSDELDWVKDNLQINAEVVYVDMGDDCKDCIELELMSKCSHNIIANSSFSWWAAYLNSNPNKIVISPAKWVIREDVNARIKLQFPSWIKL